MPEPARNLDEVLAACLEEIAAGLTVTECLERNPKYAEELRPLLALAGQLSQTSWPALSSGTRARGRARLHQAFDELPVRFFTWLPIWEQAVALTLIAVALTAAWLAWPGRTRQTVTPANVATSVVAPVAIPTESPPATVDPAATPEASRTAQPTTGPTPTPTATASRTATSTASPTTTASPTSTDEGKMATLQAPQPVAGKTDLPVVLAQASPDPAVMALEQQTSRNR